MQVELHEGSLDAMLPHWRRLFAADPEATPFMSPEWAEPWWAHRSPTGRPWILLVKEAGEPVALAPLVLRRRGALRLLRPACALDYWRVLAAAAKREAAVDAIGRELARRRNQWDDFGFRAGESPRLLESAMLRAGLSLRYRKPVAWPTIALPASVEEYLATLSRRGREKFRKHLRVLDGGEMQIRSVTDPAELRATVRNWHRLQLAWWQQRAKTIEPELRGADALNFVENAVLRLVPAGLAAVWELRRSEAVVGVSINFLDKTVFYQWLNGLDPQFAKLRPGHLLISYAIRSSIEAGRKRFDFMPGGERYKYEYGATDEYLPWIVANNGASRSLAIRHCGGLVDRVRGSYLNVPSYTV